MVGVRVRVRVRARVQARVMVRLQEGSTAATAGASRESYARMTPPSPG